MKSIMAVMALLMIASLVFAIQGAVLHSNVDNEEQKFHNLQKEYFGLSKSTRDSAESGSQLNQQLVEIQNYPSELMRMKLIGVGNILTGIYVLLFGILIALIMMPVRLSKMMNK